VVGLKSVTRFSEDRGLRGVAGHFQAVPASREAGDREALKRALFLYWYSWSEPNELTASLSRSGTRQGSDGYRQ